MELNKYIDHTLLKPEATHEDIRRVCEEAKAYDTASVCVNPLYASFVAKELEGTDIKTCCVVGFPLGATPSAIKAAEAKLCVENGAEEIVLDKKGEQLHGICMGDGPIDAAFKALEQIMGCHFELDDFQIQAVTEGKEAMGSALVKLRADGKLYAGTGISTDIMGASIRAYLSAVNKIVFEQMV